jgi:glycosyltransferase involved in cell wall biosynthesis
MKVLHVIPSLSPKQGGPSLVLPVIVRALTEAGLQVDVATTDDDGTRAHLSVPLEQPIEQNGATYIYFRKSTEFYKFSFQLTRWLRKHVRDFDVVHIHALFSYSSIAAGFIARRQGVPYIVRPLGVLSRWGMQNRRPVLKALSFRMLESQILGNASAIHYTTKIEQCEAEASFPILKTVKSIVVPLPVVTKQGGDAGRFFDKFPAAKGRPIILFLSRIDPKKGIELLL